jgi:hypothetical protein
VTSTEGTSQRRTSAEECQARVALTGAAGFEGDALGPLKMGPERHVHKVRTAIQRNGTTILLGPDRASGERMLENANVGPEGRLYPKRRPNSFSRKEMES